MNSVNSSLQIDSFRSCPGWLWPALLLLLTLFSGTASADQESDFLFYGDGPTATITGYAGPGGAVVIPNHLDGLLVTTIADRAFEGSITLTSVAIPDSVTSIGSVAFFDCTSLTNVTIPNSVTSIGYSAFYRCTSLMSMSIPNGVTSISNSTFAECTSLLNVTIPLGVTSIGEFAFVGC